MDIFIIDKNKSNGIGFDEKNHRYCIRPTNYSYSLKSIKFKEWKFMDLIWQVNI